MKRWETDLTCHLPILAKYWSLISDVSHPVFRLFCKFDEQLHLKQKTMIIWGTDRESKKRKIEKGVSRTKKNVYGVRNEKKEKKRNKDFA